MASKQKSKGRAAKPARAAKPKKPAVAKPKKPDVTKPKKPAAAKPKKPAAAKPKKPAAKPKAPAAKPKAPAAAKPTTSCGCKHGDRVTVGLRTFRLNPFTGLAHVVAGPRLPGPSGLGRRERDEIRKKLPQRGQSVQALLGWQLTDDAWADGAGFVDRTERRDRQCITDRNPEIVFTMGLPGSGKSTIIRQLKLDATHEAIDPDEFAKRLPGFDPKRPELTYARSKQLADEKWQHALVTGTGRYVLDGTGTNQALMLRRVREARRAGFYTRVVYVRTSLQTALERNRQRERTVPEHIIREKAHEIDGSVVTLQDETDCFMTINNDQRSPNA